MTDEHILTLVRAAQQAPTAEDKDRILAVLHDAVADMLTGNVGPATGITFPLPVYLMSKKLGRRVDGLLFEDKTIEVDGKRWPSPSNNELCDIILGYHTTLWPVWKYTTPGGKSHSINTLRSDAGPFGPPKRQENPGR